MPSNPDPSNSGKFSRPIDPPSLPPWSRAAEERTPPPALVPAPFPAGAGGEDETPTLSGDQFSAEEVAAAQLVEPPPAVTAPTVDKEPDDPRALAKRLAHEAKQKALARQEETPMRTDDPRDLARRLAEEAKRRLNPGMPAPAPAPVDPEPSITSWDQPAATDPGEYEAVHEPSMPVYGSVFGQEAPTDPDSSGAFDDGPTAEPYDPDPEPPPHLPTSFAKGRSLAERAASAAPKKSGMSAMEALAAARLAEAQQAAGARRPAPAPPAPAPPPASGATAARHVRPTAPPPQAVPAAAPAGPAADPSAVFAEVLPGAAIEPPLTVTQLDVFRALWRAHRARALHEHDFDLVATASVLLDAADRGVRIAAARVSHGGRSSAAWVDLDRRVLLGVARPPEVYLAGL